MSDNALLLTSTAHTGKTDAKFVERRVMFAGIMCLAFSAVTLQGCSHSESTTAPIIFDPWSPMVSYEDDNGCGARGPDAQFDSSECDGNNWVLQHSEGGSKDLGVYVFTDRNDCHYFKYKIYACDDDPASFTEMRNHISSEHPAAWPCVGFLFLAMVMCCVHCYVHNCSDREAREFRPVTVGLDDGCESSREVEKSTGTWLYYFPSGYVMYKDFHKDDPGVGSNDAAHEKALDKIGWKKKDCLGGSIDIDKKAEEEGRVEWIVKTNSRSINSENAFWRTKRGQQIGRPDDDGKAKEKFKEENVDDDWIIDQRTWGQPAKTDKQTFKKLGQFLQAQGAGVVHEVEEELKIEIEAIRDRYEEHELKDLPEADRLTHWIGSVRNLWIF